LIAPVAAIPFAYPWDIIAIRERIWYFERPYVLGIEWLGLPIEEWVFIIFVTLLFGSVTALLWDAYGIRE